MKNIYDIRARYSTPDNACKPDVIGKMAPIAIAHDVVTLVAEIEELRSKVSMLEAELIAVKIPWMNKDSPPQEELV